MSRISRSLSTRLAAAIGTMGLALTLIGAAPASAAFTSPKVIRTAPTDRVPRLGDIATAGQRVAVAWTENWSGFHGGDLPRVFAKASPDRGQTWGPTWQIETDEAHQPSVAICGGRYLFVAYAVDLRSDVYPNWWAIILYQRDLVSGVAWADQISGGSQRAQDPDVACGGDRVWVAWDDKVLAKRHAYLTHSKLGAPGTLSFATAIDLGRTRPTGGIDNGPSVAAVTGRGYVAWGAPRSGGGSNLRFRRFLVGPAPGYAVTPQPAVTLKSSSVTFFSQPEMEAQGDRVAVSYPLAGGDSAVRVSGDRGVSFAPQVALRNPPATYGYPISIALRGSRIAVIVSEWVEGPAGNGRFISTNGRSSFSRTMLSGDKGGRVAAFLVVSGTPKLVEAWDGYWYNVRKLRFHRQTT